MVKWARIRRAIVVGDAYLFRSAVSVGIPWRKGSRNASTQRFGSAAGGQGGGGGDLSLSASSCCSSGGIGAVAWTFFREPGSPRLLALRSSPGHRSCTSTSLGTLGPFSGQKSFFRDSLAMRGPSSRSPVPLESFSHGRFAIGERRGFGNFSAPVPRREFPCRAPAAYAIS